MSNYPNSAVILADDFNKLCFKCSAKYFHLKSITNLPTKGNSTLDQIFNNLQDFYIAPNRRFPFGLYLIISQLLFSRQYGKNQCMSEKRTTIKVHDKRRSNMSLVLAGSPRTSRWKILYHQFKPPVKNSKFSLT